jgi:hypothetical protein
MMKILAGMVLLAFAGASHADSIYAGATYGMTSLKISCANTTNCDVHDSGPKAYVGLKLTPQISLEGSYIDFGNASYRLNATSHASGAVRALVGNLAFRYAFIPEFGGVARLGFANVRSSGTITTALGSSKDSQDEIQPYYGLGFEYRFDKTWWGVIGADFTRGEVGGVKARLEMYSIGAQAQF